MFPLSCLIIDKLGKYNFHEGILFKIPADLSCSIRINQVILRSKHGWSTDDLGYHSYTIDLSSGDRIIIFGLIIFGEKPPKKIHGYSTCFQKSDIETYAKSIIETAEINRKEYQAEVNNLVHDLRSLSTTIYHAANEANIFLEKGNFIESSTRIGNIVAAQGILKIRIDAYDYLSNYNSLNKNREIPIFRKIDKVVRFLKPNAADGNKTIRLNGESYRKVIGPDLLELVPYPIIDNAVKYSPTGGAIDVSVQDAQSTRIMITSLGPKISRNEEELIFGRGIRGEGAIATGLPGTGLGLHVAYRIVTESFYGEIRVQQSGNTSNINGLNFYETTFTIELPSVA